MTGGLHHLDLIIVGGESGPSARPCNIDWIRSTVQQCADAGVACFVKQMGSHVDWTDKRTKHGMLTHPLSDPKGGDMIEWPYDLRVRQMPTGETPCDKQS